MVKQRTLKNVIKAVGVTVHSGERAEVTFCPAPPNTGIVFERVDLEQPVEIPANHEFINNTVLNTTLIKDGVKISTVEHLMSALAGLGIDNVRVQVNTSELPIMDGSAGPFVFLLQSAGIVEQNVAKKFIRIKKPIVFRDDNKFIKLKPHNGFKISFRLEYDHPVFQNSPQIAEIDFSKTSYIKEVSRARTFGFLADYEKIRLMGLSKGASLDNTLVIGDYRVLNQDGLRYEDEFVRHKILDAIGDLYLCGSPIIGSLECCKSGHAMNNQLVQKLINTTGAWEYVTYEEKESAPVSFLHPVLTPAS
ncbi:MAG: UDP-3-O-acyl-N-acetylglucosamine deacetylase [Pseudomonadota bacterium]